MPDRTTIDEFLALPRIGFVGASRDPKQFANSVYRHLRDGGRTLVPVHPEAASIEGDPCVRTVGDLPDGVDGVLVMLPPPATRAVVDECIAHGIGSVWLHRGVGSGAVSEEAVSACRNAGVAVVDGACPLMFAEPVGWFHRAHRSIARRHFDAA
jgi:predicted CoA-binding protein